MQSFAGMTYLDIKLQQFFKLIAYVVVETPFSFAKVVNPFVLKYELQDVTVNSEFISLPSCPSQVLIV